MRKHKGTTPVQVIHKTKYAYNRHNLIYNDIHVHEFETESLVCQIVQ